MSTSRKVDNETMAGVNSRFAEMTEDDILRIQDNAIANNTKKATKVKNESFHSKQCFNSQFAHMSSGFCHHTVTAFLNPDRQAPLIPLSLNNNCPSTAPFQSPVQVRSAFVEQNVSIKGKLNVANFKVISISKHMV